MKQLFNKFNAKLKGQFLAHVSKEGLFSTDGNPDEEHPSKLHAEIEDCV